jgi:hypothetical protein
MHYYHISYILYDNSAKVGLLNKLYYTLFVSYYSIKVRISGKECVIAMEYVYLKNMFCSFAHFSDSHYHPLRQGNVFAKVSILWISRSKFETEDSPLKISNYR